MQRIERLINLVAALLETRLPLTAEELRERVPGYPPDGPAARRAFERDKETLREMGVPIAFEQVPGADIGVLGYRIPKDEYYLRDPGLAPDELAALHLAASAVRVEGAGGMDALWKLGGEAADEAPAAMTAAIPGGDHLAPLFGAISDRRLVSFAYRGREREMEPRRLSFRSGYWYLAALDRAAGEERSYRLDRIESDVVAGAERGAFEPAPAGGAVARPWEFGGDEAVVAELEVDGEQAAWVVAQLGDQAVEHRRDDGSVRLVVPVTNRDAFRTFVLGFLDHAEVVGPPELRADMVSWLEGLCRT